MQDGAASEPAAVNIAAWRRGRLVREYANRALRPVEVLLLVRHHDQVRRRVLELGCGAGRIAGYLVALAAEASGIDVSERMIAECRRRYPAGRFLVGDMRDLSPFESGSLDMVMAGCNVLDVLDDGGRRAVLRDIRRVLDPNGVLIMSSHNRAHLPRVSGPGRIRRTDPLRFGADLVRAPGRIRRHRRLVRLERHEPDYALVSDGAHGFTLVHYFTTPEAQFRQFEDEGLRGIWCGDLDGNELRDGYTAPNCSELHYVAIPA